MKEFHVLIKFNATIPLNSVFYFQSVTRFKQDGRVINELPIENRVNSYNIFIDLRLNLMRDIVVDRIAHIFRKNILKTFLIEHIIIENFH